MIVRLADLTRDRVEGPDAAAGSRYLEVITREVAAFLDALATR